jgi:enoyl-CoA hydratase/carnithine racemase
MSNAILVEEHESSIVIRFNRPEIRSPLSLRVLERLADLVGGVKKQPNIRRLIFTGVGNVFASGADLREIAELISEDARAFAERGQNLTQQIENLRVLTVAAVNGVCFGGALDLALACNRRIASPDAVFSHPGASLGIITGWGGTQRLPRLVGEANALEMFFTAKRITADDAVRIGLIDAIRTDVLQAALQTPVD